jgi:hypothetical protein
MLFKVESVFNMRCLWLYMYIYLVRKGRTKGILLIIIIYVIVLLFIDHEYNLHNYIILYYVILYCVVLGSKLILLFYVNI